MTTIPISMKETAVWGHVVVTNAGTDDITLTSAELLPAASGSGKGQTVSAFAAGPDRDLYAIGADRVLPKEHIAPLPGTVVSATAAGKDRGVDVIFQVRPSKPGRVVYDRVRITYQSAGHSYEEQTPQGLTVCAAATRPTQKACTAD